MTNRNHELEAKILEAASKCESAYRNFTTVCDRKGAGSSAAGDAKRAWDEAYKEVEALTTGYSFGH